MLFTTKGAPFSVSVYHAGALAPATNVVIADELTCGQARNQEFLSLMGKKLFRDSSEQASMNRLGLIWIENTGNSTHFDTVIGAEIDLNTEHDRLKCQIKTGGFKHKNFINTGLVGFIKAPDKPDDPAELFIIGRKEEEVNIRGMVFQVRQIFETRIIVIYGLLILIFIIYSRTISKRQW